MLPTQCEFRFDGSTYDAKRDSNRLGDQYLRVLNAMSDGKWHTLNELSEQTGDGIASISARLRDMRKERFGSHKVEREYVGGGLFQYRLTRE